MWRPFSESIDEIAIPEATAHAPFLVVHLWADWNGYDRMMDRALKRLNLEFQGRVQFRSLDTEDPEHHDYLRRIGLLNLPSLILYARGKEPRLITGMRPIEELRKIFGSLVEDWEAVIRRA